MLPNVKQQINELVRNLEDDEIREIQIDLAKLMGFRSTLLADFDDHVVLLREAFLEQIRGDTDTVFQTSSLNEVNPEMSPHAASLDDFAMADMDDFDSAIRTYDDSAVVQKPSLAFGSSAEAAREATDTTGEKNSIYIGATAQ
ncbi:hypothetical protein HC256_009990 [Beauveria bassiana]|nr:hypothetical protein HC256_009990 [Beauveria bassiana]